MSAQELIFSCGDLEITVGAAGFPSRAEHARRPGHNYLAGQDAPGPMIIDGREQSWEFAGLITDVAESEARYAVRDHPQLEYTVRNSFTGSWLQRHMLLNTSSAPVQVDDLVLPLLPGEGSIGWARTAADEISWMVQPADGSGPLLVGELTSGAISRLAEDGFRTGRLVLPANRRYVLQWRIESAADAISVSRSRPTLSPRTELPTGEPYEIADPDTAIVVDDPVSVSQESFPLHGSVQVVVSSTPGRYPIELRSSRGTSRIDLAWVPSTDEVITELSGSWIGGRRSSAGVALLPAAGAALGLQHAVIGRLIDVDEEAEDVLALHGARLLGQERLSIMEQAFLAQEAVRTGDPEPLQRARTALLEVEEVEPGLGLAGTRLCLAELALGGSPAEIIGRLRELGAAAHQAAEQDLRQIGGGHLLDEAAKLEMIAVTGPAVVGGSTTSVLPHALAVGAELGSGLPGRRLGSLGPANAIYAAAVLDLLPDDLGPELQRRWGVTPHTLAERTRTSALASALWPVGPSTSSGSGASTSSGSGASTSSGSGASTRPGSGASPGSDSASEGELAEAIGWLVLGRPIE